MTATPHFEGNKDLCTITVINLEKIDKMQHLINAQSDLSNTKMYKMQELTNVKMDNNNLKIDGF